MNRMSVLDVRTVELRQCYHIAVTERSHSKAPILSRFFLYYLQQQQGSKPPIYWRIALDSEIDGISTWITRARIASQPAADPSKFNYRLDLNQVGRHHFTVSPFSEVNYASVILWSEYNLPRPGCVSR